MEEKKLTDEELVKDIKANIKYMYDNGFDEMIVDYEDMKQYLDLIHRLQNENAKQKTEIALLNGGRENLLADKILSQEEIERLTSLYDSQSGFMTSSIGDLPLTVEGLRTAVDEIARLDRVQAELQDYNEKNYNEAKDLRRKNAELQKQVDELTDKLGKVLLGVKADEVLIAKGVEQAVKDTAKEILQDFYKRFVVYTCVGDYYTETEINEEIQKFAKRYGVEVE